MGRALASDSSNARGRPFVVVATQRTGSTLLVRSLDASPLVFCAGEIYRTGPHIHHSEYCFPQSMAGSQHLAFLGNSFFQKRRIERHLGHFYHAAGTGVRAVGFKVMVSQSKQFDELLPTLARLGVVRLFLYRNDSFATALSHLKARATGIYHSDRVDGPAASRVITADVHDFRTLLAKCESQRDELRDLHATYGGRLLTYEELTGDWDSAIASIGKDLGIADLRVPRVLEKLGTGAPAVRVENEADLRRQFAIS